MKQKFERMMICKFRCPRCNYKFYHIYGHALPACVKCRELPTQDGLWEEHVIDVTPKRSEEIIT